jgi:hypothetical protein
MSKHSLVGHVNILQRAADGVEHQQPMPDAPNPDEVHSVQPTHFLCILQICFQTCMICLVLDFLSIKIGSISTGSSMGESTGELPYRPPHPLVSSFLTHLDSHFYTLRN